MLNFDPIMPAFSQGQRRKAAFAITFVRTKTLKEHPSAPHVTFCIVQAGVEALKKSFIYPTQWYPSDGAVFLDHHPDLEKSLGFS